MSQLMCPNIHDAMTPRVPAASFCHFMLLHQTAETKNQTAHSLKWRNKKLPVFYQSEVFCAASPAHRVPPSTRGPQTPGAAVETRS